MKTVHQRSLRLVLTGFAMGLADLIPGVSGGTIAFLSGIYEELLESIKQVSGPTLRQLLQGHWRAALDSVPWRFLVPLLAGLFGAIFSLAHLLAWLLTTYPVFVWAFFFGLVLASTWVVLKRVVRWDTADVVTFIVAGLAAYVLVGLVPVQTPATLPLLFVSGMIAICAMILPGISGSFILLLLGKYEQVLHAVTERDVLPLAVFAAGCAIGLSLFARFLTWLFAHHHDISVAALSGIMLGSIRKIWPWKEVVSTRLDSHGEIVPLIEHNVLPPAVDASVLGALVLAAAAAAAVLYLERLKLVKEQTHDLDDPTFAARHRQSLTGE